MSNNIYPVSTGQKPPFYVEFNRGGMGGEFTLFRRNFMYSPSELAEMEKKSPEHAPMLKLCNEVHPWNLFTAEYGKDGSVPDRKWIEWMVDALNSKAEQEEMGSEYFS
jgi:hypothetical protein